MKTTTRKIATRGRLENLALLAVGLHALSEKVGSLRFGMAYWLTADGIHVISNPLDGSEERELLFGEKNRHECGTSACAAGHGPLFGIAGREEDGEDWYDYVERVFLRSEDLPRADAAWDWMFGASWRVNIIEGKLLDEREEAAKRIAWYLEHQSKNDGSFFVGPSQFEAWDRRDEFNAWQPDWDAIRATIPEKKLKGIAWIEDLDKGEFHSTT